MTSGPAISTSIILIGLLVLGLGGVGLVIVFLRGQRQEGAAPSPATRIGCTLFAIAAMATLVFVGRGCAIDQRIVGEEIYTILCPGAEIFLGESFLGTGSTAIELEAIGGREFPAGTSTRDIVSKLFPDATDVVITPGSTAGAGVADRLITISPTRVELVRADGSIDSCLLVTRSDRAMSERSSTPPSDRVWVIRVRDGIKKRVTIDRVSTKMTPPTFLERLTRFAPPPSFSLVLKAISTPEESMPGGTKAPYWIDQLPPTAPSDTAESVPAEEPVEEGK